MTVVLAALAGAAIATPHMLRLEGVHPATAASIWLAAMCLRGLAALFAALFVILYLPATSLFAMITHWCWHWALPVLTTHLGFSGHAAGDVALLAPLIGLAASLASVCFGLWNAARVVGTWVRRTSIGPGPQESVVVGEHDIVVAAAGMRRPRVIVSAGALTTFDDEELAASLAHERGHIERRHRFVLLVAEVARALARLQPGARRAVGELVFHLERDADRWALERRHDPGALASAICKAARQRAGSQPALQALGGRGVTPRVRQLLAVGATSARQLRFDVLAVGMVGLVLALGAALPSATLAGVDHASRSAAAHRCPD